MLRNKNIDQLRFQETKEIPVSRDPVEGVPALGHLDYSNGEKEKGSAGNAFA